MTRQGGRIKQAEASADRVLAAFAGLRRQLRIRNILLAIVGAEVIVFVALRTWSGC